MRLPVEKIKAAILHPEEEVRLTAVRYFGDSPSGDASIMPLVIQAVEQYGHGSAFRILRDAEHLVQTASTLAWLIQELRRDYDLQLVPDDNHRFALALVVLNAPVDLLVARKAEIDALTSFPEELRGPLDERIGMATWTWEQAWQALEDFGRRTMRGRSVSLSETRHADRVLEALARHPEQGSWVLGWLDRRAGENDRLAAWLETEVIRLAGAMRLEGAIPLLVETLGDEDVMLSDSASRALRCFGSDAVVTAIAEGWWDSDEDYRGAAADVLEKIHTDHCVEKCLEFLAAEDDPDTALTLGHAALSHFAFEAVEPVRELVVGTDEELIPDENDLRYFLTATATIMGAEFPEYEAWYRDALANNWGWGDYERGRVSDNFRAEPERPKRSGTDATRLPVETIKQALLHSDRGVREAALFYFAKSSSADPMVMLLVIESIERFGLDAFPILSAADTIRLLAELGQTDETVAWLIHKIESPSIALDELDTNLRASLVTALRHADVDLLQRNAAAIQDLESLDNDAREIIADRIAVGSLTPDALWRELIDFCEAEHDPEGLDDQESEHIGSVVQALGRFPEQVAERVLNILSEADGSDEWLEGLAVGLAGELRLEAAVPLLVDRFDECGEWVCEQAEEALAKIGTDAVVREIAERYGEAEWPFRLAAATTLQDIHTDLVVPTCWDLFDQEQDVELQAHLLRAMLMNFSPEAIEPARQYILRTPRTPDLLEVRADLLVACKLMERTFPEFEQWLDDSQYDVEFRKQWYAEHSLARGNEEDFGDEDAAEFAEEVLGDDDWEEAVDDEPSLTIVRRSEQVGRNDPCPCGSGKKFKKCCSGKQSVLEETDEDHAAAISSVRPLKSPPKFPIGTVALYGPDDRITTKIVAGVVKREGAEAIVERWVGTSIKENPKVQRKIQEFFARHGVKSVVATDANFGCPHEEGLDFPSGEDCPFCPFWAGKQGSHRRD
jgi:hypothetical protein